MAGPDASHPAMPARLCGYGGVTLTPLGGPLDAARRPSGGLFTDRSHPGVVWNAAGGLFWGRFE